MEMVQWVIRVTCCGKAGGAMHVREASLTMEDTEERHATGRDNFVILQDAMENDEGQKLDPEEAKARFDKFSRLKREIKERKLWRDSVMDTIAMLVSFTIFVSLFWFMVFGFRPKTKQFLRLLFEFGRLYLRKLGRKRKRKKRS